MNYQGKCVYDCAETFLISAFTFLRHSHKVSQHQTAVLYGWYSNEQSAYSDVLKVETPGFIPPLFIFYKKKTYVYPLFF